MNRPRILLKNGLIIDGTGQKGKVGHVLIEGDKIKKISEVVIDGIEQVIDCQGKVIAPGFIDMHSHNDWFLPSDEIEKFTNPFLFQGITTFIGGNCGYGIAGFRRNCDYKDKIEDNIFKAGHHGLHWDTMEEYYHFISNKDTRHNLATLAGHGTSRTSIRGFDPTTLRNDEMKELLWLLEEAMEQGAKGVSLGLQYEPGLFATQEELRNIAKLVKRKDKVLTVHAKAFSILSGAYPLKPFGTPHNLIALKDIIEIARDTEVKLQLSHLIFAGTKTWKTYEKALKMINQAIEQGIDIKFDTYAYHCGASVITVFLPEWFMAKVPHSYHDKSALRRLRLEIELMKKLVGYNFSDIQVTYANHPDLNIYNGMFLDEIAKHRGLSPFENYIDIAKKSNGTARVIMYKYSNQEIIEELLKHPASLYMTDSWLEPVGAQNPAAFGCFPRILQYVRDKKILSLEETIHKMTGASAARFSIKDRGLLQEGLAADITVFDSNTIKDNTTVKETDKLPTSIEHVFINGYPVMQSGSITGPHNSGRIIK